MARTRMEGDKEVAADEAKVPGGAPGVVELPRADHPRDARGDGPLVEAAPVVGDATKAYDIGEARRAVKPPPQYRVKVGGPILSGGHRTVLKPGKLIDARNYDLKALRNVGIVLEPVAPEDQPAR